MATFRAIVLKGKIHLKKDNTSNIKIRITHNQKSEYIPTDLFIQPDNLKNGTATGTNAAFINMRITDYLQIYQRRYLKLGDMAEKLNVRELRDELLKDHIEQIDFLKFAEDYQKQLIADKKFGSERAVRGLLTNLNKFQADIQFSDITSNFLREFEKYLNKQGIYQAVETYMSRFRVIFNKGREFHNDEDRGILKIKNYPFKKYQVNKVRDKSRPGTSAKDNSLTLDQLKKLIEYNPVGRRETLAKNMFLLMICLIGPNTKDLFAMPKPNRTGRIVYNRFKTGKKISIKAEPEALTYAACFAGTSKLTAAEVEYSDYLNFQKALNIGLKLICKNIRDIEKNETGYTDWPVKITTNWARHTWATIARNDCRVSKDDVALCLGHEDIDNRVTDMYIKYDYSIVDEANRKVLDLVFC
ncbi:MAG: hypothetical protein EOM76_07245 [Sphingobacteriia bacterium]|nr:hypothetical protein [Sphingobacteriia bacterium]